MSKQLLRLGPIGCLLCCVVSACGGPDWETICADIEQKGRACFGAQAIVQYECSAEKFEPCDNEENIANVIEECTAQPCDRFLVCSRETIACQN